MNTMNPRRSFVPLAVAATLVFAACGGGSSDSGADGNDVDGDIDNALDDVSELAEETATTVPDESEPEEAAPAPELDPADARCANVTGNMIEAEFEDVDCGEPHDAEYAGTVEAPEGRASTDVGELDIILTSVCLDTTESLVGSPLNEFSLEVLYETETMPGQSFFGDVACWARSAAYGSLSASLRDVDLATALGDFVTLGSIQPGECFLPAEDNSGSLSIGMNVDCDTPLADQILGTVTIDDGDFPGNNDLFDISDVRCPVLAEDAAFEVIGDTVGAITMFETEWTAYGIRDIVCTSYRSSDLEAGPTCGLRVPGQGHDQVPCEEPHDSEFVGLAAPPEGSLPLDSTEAEILLTALCAPLVSDYLDGRDLAQSGVGAGFDVGVGLGDPFVDDINCWATVGSPVGMTGSIAEFGLDGALDYAIVNEIGPGACFVYAPNTFDLGTVVPCDTPEAFMAIGLFTVDDDGPHPGDDALREIRFERCSELLAESGLAADPATVSGVFPGEIGWTAHNRREISCDATPL